MIGAFGVVGIVAFIAFLYRQYTRISIADIPGPEPESFLLGNLCELYKNPAGETDFQWQKSFGSIVRFKGPFGEDRLMLSDPKAIQYILHSGAYHFQKPSWFRGLIKVLNGPDLVWSEGDVHKRQRKVMLPAFGGPESRALFPIFRSISGQLVSRWQDSIGNESENTSTVVDVASWLGRATLDAIGEAAFDYKFGGLDGSETELGKAYNDLTLHLFGLSSTTKLFVEGIAHHFPLSIIEGLYKMLPSERLAHVREARTVSNRVAKELVTMKKDMLLEGKSKRDVMSLLVRANVSTDSKIRLTDEELYGEMGVILSAGHETMATSLTWTLWELAKSPEIQTRLRDEIRATEAILRTRGDSDFELSDFENMHYLQAVMKEALRFHPAVCHLVRQADRDVVLPLSKPIQTKSGKIISEIPLCKGTNTVISLAAYNRNPDLWGDDAHVFNPDRWIFGKAIERRETPIGVLGNLLNFSSGTRSCIGWRFAITSMQCFLVDIVNNFKLDTACSNNLIRREGCALMFPMVDGELADGVKLPLDVSVAPRD